jgi:hypothetical protein
MRETVTGTENHDVMALVSIRLQCFSACARDI